MAISGVYYGLYTVGLLSIAIGIGQGLDYSQEGLKVKWDKCQLHDVIQKCTSRSAVDLLKLRANADQIQATICRQYQESEKCFDQMINACLEEKNKFTIRKMLEGRNQLTMKICTDTKYQEKYLSMSTCLHKHLEEHKLNCEGPIQTILKALVHYQKDENNVEGAKLLVKTSCIAIAKMISCTKEGVLNIGCGQEAADFYTEMLDYSLGTILMGLETMGYGSCAQYGYSRRLYERDQVKMKIASSAFGKCNVSELQGCIVKLKTAVSNMINMDSMNKMESFCMTYAEAMQCMKDKIDLCSDPKLVEDTTISLSGLVSLGDNLCNNQAYQKEFQKHIKCLGLHMLEWHYTCKGPAEKSMLQTKTSIKKPLDNRSFMHQYCSAIIRLLDCTSNGVFLQQCGEEAAEFYRNMLDQSFASGVVQLISKGYGSCAAYGYVPKQIQPKVTNTDFIFKDEL